MSPTTQPREHERGHGHARGSTAYRRLLAALLCAGVATFAQLYSPQGVLPQIAADLGTSADRAALTVSAATLGLALAVVPWSFVGDRFGRLRAMVLAVASATVLGLVAAWAPTFEAVLALRLLEGVALGGVPALAMAYLNEEVDARAASIAAGWFVGGTTIGGLLGRVVATPVADASSWRVGMTTVSAMAAAAAVAFVVLAPRERRFVAVPVGSVLAQTRRVLVNLSDRALLGLYVSAFLLMGGFVAVYNYLGFRLTAEPYLLPGWAVGLIFLAYLAGTVSAPRAGELAARHGRYVVLVGCVLVMVAGLLLTLAGPLWLVLAGLLVLTAGFFGAHSVASGWAGARAVTARAQSTGLYNLAYYGGSSVLGWAGGLAFEATGWAGVVAFVVGAALVALAVQRVLVRPAG
ncbi:MFS transporter [Ornithinimicrobium pekingense]|uniref:MFS transporter n=1 Tax=Ornithinimicrobium pekingense TaxID=384677 RepID=A0ABQ2F7P8_9MICO|nr:MFS transporter [Ornithinimicrobium pekingense]GGK67910.1 MFS transporter [Ornithinimicrobium pekingense]